MKKSAPVLEEEPAAEEAPAAEQPEVQPAAQPSLPDLLAEIVSRLVALEGIAHSGHNIGDEAIDQIAALVLERINASIQQRLR